MASIHTAAGSIALVALAAGACAVPPEAAVDRDEANMTNDWFAEHLAPGEDTNAVLSLVNDLQLRAADYVATCRFTPAQAAAIIDYRQGDDPADPSDDQIFNTVFELDRVAFTNESFWTAAIPCARAHHTINPGGQSVCPPPAQVAPIQTPAGFLPAVQVRFPYMLDGDSGRFDFPNALAQPVRLLYVNTEETGGEQMTAFGVETKGIVIDYVRHARDVQVAVQESSPGSGLPKSDPYGRWLALLFIDGELFQTRLAREGLSAYYTVFGCAAEPVHSALLYAEAEANKARRGIWGPGPHNDYQVVFSHWIGTHTCRPNPFNAPYCQ